jgi:hypothetical protein
MGLSNPIEVKQEFPAWVRLGTTALLTLGILGIFIVRTSLAYRGNPPRLFAIFNGIILLASMGVLAFKAGGLRRGDWLAALIGGGLLGAGVRYTSFYPFIVLPDPNLSAWAHGAAVAVVCLAGISVMRQGGPVVSRLAHGKWKMALRSAGFGLLVGLPLAGLNVLVFSWMQKQPIQPQNPLTAGFEALQPGLVEEIAYRFALLGFIWLVMRRAWPERAVLVASLLSLFVHNYAHFDALLRDNLAFALAYGAVVGLIWGLPMTLLAVRRDLESAIAFHWMQDFLRFASGF